MRLSLCVIATLLSNLQGCIIYEEKYTTTGCEGCFPDTTGPGQHPDGTQITEDFSLSVSEGLPGESVLTTLIATDNRSDISSVVSVSFDRDIVVVDSLEQELDLVLLLGIDEAAAPGAVEVFVETNDGKSWVLSRPFEILPLETLPTGDTGITVTDDTEDSSNDTGTDDTGTDDTGTDDTGTGDTGPDGTGTGDTGTGTDGFVTDIGGQQTGDTGATQ